MDIIIANEQVDELQFARRVVSSYLLNPVHTARTTTEVLDAVFPPGTRAAHVPQLVVASLGLPPAGGIELARTLRCDSRTAAVPIVLVARPADKCDRFRSSVLPRTVCIQGPLDLDTLTEALRQIGISWVLMDNPLSTPPMIAPWTSPTTAAAR